MLSMPQFPFHLLQSVLCRSSHFVVVSCFAHPMFPLIHFIFACFPLHTLPVPVPFPISHFPSLPFIDVLLCMLFVLDMAPCSIVPCTCCWLILYFDHVFSCFHVHVSIFLFLVLSISQLCLLTFDFSTFLFHLPLFCVCCSYFPSSSLIRAARVQHRNEGNIAGR